MRNLGEATACLPHHLLGLWIMLMSTFIAMCERDNINVATYLSKLGFLDMLG